MAIDDGSSAKNLTGGVGRKTTTQLRLVRLDPRQQGIDLARPLLVRAENEETRDTGFYRITPGSTSPKLLSKCNHVRAFVVAFARAKRLPPPGACYIMRF